MFREMSMPTDGPPDEDKGPVLKELDFGDQEQVTAMAHKVIDQLASRDEEIGRVINDRASAIAEKTGKPVEEVADGLKVELARSISREIRRSAAGVQGKDAPIRGEREEEKLNPMEAFKRIEDGVRAVLNEWQAK